jgi:hypothetical protein
MTDEQNLPTLRKGGDMKPPKPVNWLLAPNYLAAGRVGLLVGEEGIGKSMLAIRALACVTTGKPWGPFTIAGEPRDAIIIATEDGWEDTVRPRLELAGADVNNRIHVFSEDDNGEGSPIFPHHMEQLRTFDSVNPALVVVDSWIDTVAGGFNVKDPQHCRQAMRPWKEYAAATGAAVWLVTHVNRMSSPDARKNYGLSGALRQVARTAIYVMRDADDHNVMLAGPEKSNVGRTDIPAARFNITPVVKFEVTAASDGTVGRLDFLGMSDRTIKQHLADGPALGGGESRTDPVDQWLTARLADGRVPTADITREADKLDFGPGQLRTSKERLKVTSRKIGTTWYTGYEHQLVNHLVNLSSRHLDSDDEDDEMESQVDDGKLTTTRKLTR